MPVRFPLVVAWLMLPALLGLPAVGAHGAAFDNGHRLRSQVEAGAPCAVPATPFVAHDKPARDGRPADGQPDGAAMTMLAQGAADDLPVAPGRLALSRLSFEPGAGSVLRQAAGAILFYVEDGTVVAYLNGVEERLDPGASAVVQEGQLYRIAQAGTKPASVLRLAITPPETTDVEVGNTIEVREGSNPRSEPPVPPESAPLVRGEVDPLPSAAELVIACLHWESGRASSIAETIRHPGPVGIHVIQGSVRIDEERELPTGGCTLIQAGTSYAIWPADGPATLLVFGAIAAGQDFWQTGADDAGASPGSAGGPGDATCGPMT